MIIARALERKGRGKVRGRVRGRVRVRSRGIEHRDSRARAENGSKDGAIMDRIARRLLLLVLLLLLLLFYYYFYHLNGCMGLASIGKLE